ncbi:glutathione-dependent formaldehyde dehydrogenase [Myxococcaceae bacterium JPH2]|nr:glutathione-dependent formaldehyde dehydrogenase [Myxococcaceae bacterium JPH2]
MKAVVFHGVGDIRLDDVPEPRLERPTDAIVRLSASAICGTDLHMVRGTLPGMKPGTILGHEGVGYIEALGDDVRNFDVGDRVVIPSTIACGNCVYCRAGYTSQCDVANPNGSGTAFFGGPESSGSFPGMQAEKVRVPFANVGLVRVPEGVSDEQAILISDIFPTGYMAAELAEVTPGDTVAVFGVGPVGLFAIASALLMDAGRVFAIDCHPDRLELARARGAEVINFDKEDPVVALRRLTGGIGVDRAIDAVGIDAVHPHHGPGGLKARADKAGFQQEQRTTVPHAKPAGANWVPGDGPSQALRWAVSALAKAGTLSIIGVYPETARSFPIGEAMNKNLTVNMGNCNHRPYIPRLLELVRSGAVDPTSVISHVEPMTGALEAYRNFDLRKQGWMKVELEPMLSQ